MKITINISPDKAEELISYLTYHPKGLTASAIGVFLSLNPKNMSDALIKFMLQGGYLVQEGKRYRLADNPPDRSFWNLEGAQRANDIDPNFFEVK